MKLEVFLAEGAPEALIVELNSRDFQRLVLSCVIHDDLKAESIIGPAEFFIPRCQFASGTEPMCAVTLTRVSVTPSRATNDFLEALGTLERLYLMVLEKYYTTDYPCQLFISMVLDQPPFGRSSPLLELPPIMIPFKPKTK